MPTARRAAPSPKGRAGRLISIVGSLVGLIGVAFVINILASEWTTVVSSFETATVPLLLASVPVGAAGMGWIGFQWNATVDALGGDRVGSAALYRSYYVGQLGKYIPGGVWPVLGRSELLARFGTPRRVAYPSVGLSMAVTYLAAVLLAAVSAPFALNAVSGAHAWYLAVLPVGLLVLHPAVLGKITALGERLFSRGEPTVVPPWRTTVGLVFRHVPAWALISLATYCVARALHFDVGLSIICFATPLSWGAGLIAVPVPGGIGVREAVFVALLASSLGSADAAALAVTSRLAFIAADVIAATIAFAATPAPPRAVV